jgi:hypothetical protein
MPHNVQEGLMMMNVQEGQRLGYLTSTAMVAGLHCSICDASWALQLTILQASC